MKKLLMLVVVALFFSLSIYAQTTPSASPTTTATTESKPKKKSFRANQEQIMQAQKMLKVAETGKMDGDTKTAVKMYQGENGLRKSGSLNRATLEKMTIALTDAQKEIPIPASSYVVVKTMTSDGGETKKRGPVFRASKEQIMETQKKLKDGGMYAGEQTGKLDDATREGLKKYQEANGLKVTGTLNQVTLEKMGVPLTDKQKENAQPN